MSHHISAIVTKKTEALEELHYQSLPQGFALLLDTDENRNALSGQSYARVQTDYFGGAGEQSCQFFRAGDNDCVCDKCGTVLKPKFQKMKSINHGLIALGVVKADSDEFDAVNLGHYRDNQDIDEEARW